MTTAPPHKLDRLGTILMVLGIGLLCVEFFHQTAGLPFWMPRGWYSSRVLWLGAGIGLVIAGWRLTRGDRPSGEWSPTTPGIRFSKLTLYSREGCHLCDDARDLLFKYGPFLPRLEVIDIDGSPEIREQFDTCVPVVELDGKVRFRGRVDEVLLRRLIEGTPPR